MTDFRSRAGLNEALEHRAEMRGRAIRLAAMEAARLAEEERQTQAALPPVLEEKQQGNPATAPHRRKGSRGHARRP